MLAAIILALALTFVAPTVARAQINPLQAVGIAENVAGIVFGSMYPAPRCGPHDALPQPYQPATPPHYAAPPRPDQHANLDDDDDDEPIRPAPHRLSTYSLQPQTRPNAEDASDQTAEVRAHDGSEQPVDEAALSDEQPVQNRVRHRAARSRPAKTIAQTQSSGQVAEIPSQPRIAQPQ
jgi:hypothetical protein